MQNENTSIKLSIKQIVEHATYRYKMGQTLKSIYDDFNFAFGSADGPWYFSEFVVQNKKDKQFMKEFNTTCFINNAPEAKIVQISLF